MINATNAPGGAWMSSNGDRLRVKMRTIDDVALLTNLPNSRRLRDGSTFTINPTPYTCWKLQNRGFHLVDDSLRDMATQWMVGQGGGDWMTNFNSSMTPARHQIAAFNFSYMKPAAYLGMDMGTRKTSTANSLMAAWHAAGAIDFPCFVVCPQLVIDQWPEQWQQWCGAEVQFVMLPTKWTMDKKVKAVVDAYRTWEAQKRMGNPYQLIFVVNHESVWRKKMAKQLLARRWGAIVLDEAHRAKGNSSSIGQFIYQFGFQAQKKLALSGTPMPNNPGDIFGQYRFLDAGIFGTSWVKFLSDYAVKNEYVKQKVDEWINQDRFSELVGLLMFRVMLRDVTDLPPVTDVVVPVNVDAKLRQAYNALAKEMCTEWEGREITADNALTKMLRLQQITAGHVTDDDGNTLQVGTAKVDALMDRLGDMSPSEPVVVFTKFRPEQQQFKRAIESTHRRYLEVSSDRKDHREFIHNPQPGDVLVANIAAVGTGVDGLQQRARYAVYSSIGNNRGEYEQSRARLARDGQDKPMVFYHLRVRNSVDDLIAAAFDAKAEIVNYVMERMAGL